MFILPFAALQIKLRCPQLQANLTDWSLSACSVGGLNAVGLDVLTPQQWQKI